MIAEPVVVRAESFPAFADALRQMDARSVEAQRLEAIATVLKLVESVSEGGWELSREIESQSAFVRQVVCELPLNDPARTRLLNAMEAVVVARPPRVREAAEALEDIADRFYFRGQVALAFDTSTAAALLASVCGDARFLGSLRVKRSGFLLALGRRSEGEAEVRSVRRILCDRPSRTLEFRLRAQIVEIHARWKNIPEALALVDELGRTSRAWLSGADRKQLYCVETLVRVRARDLERALTIGAGTFESPFDPTDRWAVHWHENTVLNLSAGSLLSGRVELGISMLRDLSERAVSPSARLGARASLLWVAARTAERDAFEQARTFALRGAVRLDHRVNALIESAVGDVRFGRRSRARAALSEARALATSLGYAQSVLEAESIFSSPSDEYYSVTRRVAAARTELRAGKGKEWSDSDTTQLGVLRGAFPLADGVDLASAQALADSCLKGVSGAPVRTARAAALQVSARIARRRGLLDSAINLAREAHRAAVVKPDRRSALEDLARLCREAGRIDDEARALHRLFALEGPPESQCRLALRLMSIALARRDVSEFRRWRRAAQRTATTPAARVNVLLSLSEAARAEHGRRASLKLLQSARALARQHQLPGLVLDVERRLSSPGQPPRRDFGAGTSTALAIS